MKMLFVSILLLSGLCEARILIKSPQASTESFSTFLRSHEETSLSDYHAGRLRSNPQQEEKLFALADLPDSEVLQGLASIARIRSEGPLSELSLRFLMDLSARWISQMGASPAREEAHRLFCETSLLLKSQPQNCQYRIQPLSELHRKAPWADQLLVEGVSHALSAEGHIATGIDGRYHFTLLSNSHHKVHFYGTYQEMLQQDLSSKPLIEGTCEGFTTNTDDLALQMQARVYFSEGCVRALHEVASPQAPGWFERNKKWIFPAAAVVIGAGVYTLRDKRIVIDSTALR